MKREKNEVKTCPELRNCEFRVTQDFFKRICNTKGFINCHHFAKKRDQLKNPIDWLVTMTVADADLSPDLSHELSL